MRVGTVFGATVLVWIKMNKAISACGFFYAGFYCSVLFRISSIDLGFTATAYIFFFI